MTNGERCLTVAVMALVLACLCFRLVGQFLAGGWGAIRRFFRRRRHHRHHERRPR